MKRRGIVPLVVLAIAATASLACSTTDLIRDMLGRLPTPTTASEEHFSATYYVQVEGDDANPCSPSAPCATIRRAAELVDDDVIQIGPGTFSEVAPRTFGLGIDLPPMNRVTIRGAGKDVTVLSGEGERAIMRVTDSILAIRNLTIADGGGTSHIALHLRASVVTIEDVVVRDNQDVGVQSERAGSDLTLERVTVVDNGSVGVAIFNGRITDSTIRGNLGGGVDGAGVGGVVEITNTVIENNESATGGGVEAHEGEMTIVGSTISHNRRGDEGGILSMGGAGIHSLGDLTIINSTVSSNGAGSDPDPALVHRRGDLRLVHSTVANNLGVGLSSYAGEVTFENSLIANNGSSDCFFPAHFPHW